MPKKRINFNPPENGFGQVRRSHDLSYEISLLTPMVGGGVESWIPNKSAPVRSQSIKGHLRFWWRAMQGEDINRELLRERESNLWGSTGTASLVQIGLNCYGDVKLKILQRGDRGKVEYDTLPDYVLFPLQGQTDMNRFEVIQDCSFTLSIDCPDEYRVEVDRCVRLWVLFGGIGARTRRGCGSLYCENIMDDYQKPEDVANFLNCFGNIPALSTAPYPRLCGASFRYLLATKIDAISAWKSFLDRYKNFRQGVNCGRNSGAGHRPGRTRWPEADSIRRITGCVAGKHSPIHPANNWFPRGAYGLPIQTEFKNEHTDPQGKFMLQPVLRERWPSPVILKIIKLGNGQLLEICLILNAAIPARLELRDEHGSLHTLLANEMPLASAGKAMPDPGPILANENPYDGLIRHLGL
ncbi:MAG: type III-B CRISPR module RAMP protein Cmr1 [Deltaproteobacteria bacterium]|nr:type III-B CRISPR module RAMP protein Cmr1 [Deltaproteobacteria bacterium]